MKKVLLITIVSVLTLMSCSVSRPKSIVKTTATYERANFTTPVVAVFADLDVSPTKISFVYIPGSTISKSGYDNVLSAAVREALASNGDADVLVALESQVKYNKKGNVESVVISGYPAKYVNFRNPGDEYLRDLAKKSSDKGNSASKGIKLGL